MRRDGFKLKKAGGNKSNCKQRRFCILPLNNSVVALLPSVVWQLLKASRLTVFSQFAFSSLLAMGGAFTTTCFSVLTSRPVAKRRRPSSLPSTPISASIYQLPQGCSEECMILQVNLARRCPYLNAPTVLALAATTQLERFCSIFRRLVVNSAGFHRPYLLLTENEAGSEGSSQCLCLPAAG